LNDDGKTWVRYDDPDLIGRIERAFTYRTTSETLPIQIAGKSYTIDFRTMKQINCKTQRQRTVQRCDYGFEPVQGSVVSSGPSYWEWKDSGGWHLFDKESYHKIETAYRAHQPQVNLNHGVFANADGGYTIVFSKMEQTNNASGYTRKVRRSEGKAPTHSKNALTPAQLGQRGGPVTFGSQLL